MRLTSAGDGLAQVHALNALGKVSAVLSPTTAWHFMAPNATHGLVCLASRTTIRLHQRQIGPTVRDDLASPVVARASAALSAAYVAVVEHTLTAMLPAAAVELTSQRDRRRRGSTAGHAAERPVSLTGPDGQIAIVCVAWVGQLLCVGVIHRAGVRLYDETTAAVDVVDMRNGGDDVEGRAGSAAATGTGYVLTYLFLHPMTGDPLREILAGPAPPLDASGAPTSAPRLLDASSAGEATSAVVGSAGDSITESTALVVSLLGGGRSASAPQTAGSATAATAAAAAQAAASIPGWGGVALVRDALLDGEGDIAPIPYTLRQRARAASDDDGGGDGGERRSRSGSAIDSSAAATGASTLVSSDRRLSDASTPGNELATAGRVFLTLAAPVAAGGSIHGRDDVSSALRAVSRVVAGNGRLLDSAHAGAMQAQRRPALLHTAYPVALHASPNFPYVIAAEGDGAVRVYNTHTGALAQTIRSPNGAPFTALVACPEEGRARRDFAAGRFPASPVSVESDVSSPDASPMTLEYMARVVAAPERLYAVSARGGLCELRMVPVVMQVAALLTRRPPQFAAALALGERFRGVLRTLRWLQQRKAEEAATIEDGEADGESGAGGVGDSAAADRVVADDAEEADLANTAATMTREGKGVNDDDGEREGAFNMALGGVSDAKIRSIRAAYGFQLFSRGDYGPALFHLGAAHVPVWRVLCLYPQLLPAAEGAMAAPSGSPVALRDEQLPAAIKPLIPYLLAARRRLRCGAAPNAVVPSDYVDIDEAAASVEETSDTATAIDETARILGTRVSATALDTVHLGDITNSRSEVNDGVDGSKRAVAHSRLSDLLQLLRSGASPPRQAESVPGYLTPAPHALVASPQVLVDTALLIAYLWSDALVSAEALHAHPHDVGAQQSSSFVPRRGAAVQPVPLRELPADARREVQRLRRGLDRLLNSPNSVPLHVAIEQLVAFGRRDAPEMVALLRGKGAHTAAVRLLADELERSSVAAELLGAVPSRGVSASEAIAGAHRALHDRAAALASYVRPLGAGHEGLILSAVRPLLDGSAGTGADGLLLGLSAIMPSATWLRRAFTSNSSGPATAPMPLDARAVVAAIDALQPSRLLLDGPGDSAICPASIDAMLQLLHGALAIPADFDGHRLAAALLDGGDGASGARTPWADQQAPPRAGAAAANTSASPPLTAALFRAHLSIAFLEHVVYVAAPLASEVQPHFASSPLPIAWAATSLAQRYVRVCLLRGASNPTALAARRHSGASSSVVCAYRRRLVALLSAPAKAAPFDASAVLRSFPDTAPDDVMAPLPEERVILLRHLRRHEAALRLLVGASLADFAGADAYCEAVYAGADAAVHSGVERGGDVVAAAEADTGVYDALLRAYLIPAASATVSGDVNASRNGGDTQFVRAPLPAARIARVDGDTVEGASAIAPANTAKGPAMAARDLQQLLSSRTGHGTQSATSVLAHGAVDIDGAVMRILSRNFHRIDAAAAMRLLPPGASLASLAPFLVSALQHSQDALRTLSVTAQLTRIEQANSRSHLLEREVASVAIERNTACGICKRKLAAGGVLAVFVRSPDGGIAHLACAQPTAHASSSTTNT